MRIRERSNSQPLLKTKTAAWILKKDRLWQFAAILIVAGLISLSLSEFAIQPYKSELTYTDDMFSYNIGFPTNGVNIPNEKLNIQALAPDYPIYITIYDSSHYLLDYSVYFINDTNQAVGFGPSTLLFNGQTSNTTTLTINDPVYNMTYRLVLTSHYNLSYTATVGVRQMQYLYPPVNYFLFIPAVVALLVGAVIAGVKITAVSTDKHRYYARLGQPEGAATHRSYGGTHAYSASTHDNRTKFLNILLGIAFLATGLMSLGKYYLLTWLGIVFIFVGLLFLLNGLLSLVLGGRFRS